MRETLDRDLNAHRLRCYPSSTRYARKSVSFRRIVLIIDNLWIQCAFPVLSRLAPMASP
jgi:hypothetical protein